MADVLINAANNYVNVLKEINVELFQIDGKQLDLEYNKSHELSSEQFDVMLQLTEDNMKEFYERSQWGWNREKKLKEFLHKNAKFLILRFEGEVIAFCHFRFEYGSYESEASVYCYELQVVDEFQRRGIGKYLINILQLLAIQFKIYKVMLTVFKHNSVAMEFYMKSMKFRIDKSSPSKFDQETDYEILSLKTSKFAKIRHK